jgi:hypothetical protein
MMIRTGFSRGALRRNPPQPSARKKALAEARAKFLSKTCSKVLVFPDS